VKQVLFLCTGNYYRSRYAELIFNLAAPARGLDWKAESRALDLAAGAGNPGPLSPHVIERFRRRGIELPDPPRFPQQALEPDLAAADLVIALKQAEHRPMLLARFGRWADRVEYWHVHDVDQAPPAEALAQIEAQVDRLLEALAPGAAGLTRPD
jgi:protein-tyrosine phosphatase